MKKQTKFKQTEIGMIPKEWEVKHIDELSVEIIDGDRGTNYPNGNDFSNSGYCLFLNTKNVPNTIFYFTECMFITKEKDEILRKGKLKRKDIVLTTRGTVGNIAFYDEKIPFENIRINSGMVIIRTLEHDLFTPFLFQFLKSPMFKSQVLSSLSGSAQPQLPIRDIKKLLLLIPSLEEQRAIASILSSLDAKIELNRQMNATLEKMAETLFRHWFVDFEFPDAKGRPYRSSGGKMVDSELGKIPTGWKVGTLGELCEITMGQSPPGETYNETGAGLPFYQGISDFGFRFPSRRVYCTAPTRFAEEADALLSVRAPVGSLNVAEERCAIGRGVAALRLKGKHQEYLYYLLRATQSGWNKFEAEGTVFGSVGKSDVHGFKVVLPPEYLRERFSSFVEPVDKQITINEKQSRNVAVIRDSLLPKLMSGKIRVPISREEPAK